MMRNQEIQNILLVSIAVVSAVRITSYYSEELSRDLAKMLPFAMLGIFLIDLSYFSYQGSLTVLRGIPPLWKILVYYLLFVITFAV